MNPHEPNIQLNPENKRLQQKFDIWCTTQNEKSQHVVRTPLYHYTSMSGLIGIVRSQRMWFTHISFLNDPDEFFEGLTFSCDLLTDIIKNTQSLEKTFCELLRHLIIKAGGEIFGAYVACFSSAADDLGQWRAYADNGRGVAIGCSPFLFKTADNVDVLGDSEKTLIAKVEYRKHVCIGNIRAVIETALSAVRNSVGDDAQRLALAESITRSCAWPILYSALSYKHSAYEHEAEVRLVLFNDAKKLEKCSEMRIRGPDLVPYVPSKFEVHSPGALVGVKVGPAARRNAEVAVRTLLSKHSVDPEIVTRSNIPYLAH